MARVEAQEQRARPGYMAGEWTKVARKRRGGSISVPKKRRLAASTAGTQNHFRPFCSSGIILMCIRKDVTQ